MGVGAHRTGDVPRHVLRSVGQVSPTRSVFMDREDLDTLAATCRAIQMALPVAAVFSHLTSAALGEWRLPQVSRIPVIASTSAEAPHLDRRGVYVRRCDVPSGHRRVVAGVRIASPEWTVIELAEDLGLIDLVAVIDGLLHTGTTTVERLRAAIVPGRRGAKVLGEALAYVDGRSESWWESVLRMAHQLSNIPVESQVVLRDARGDFVARTDLQIVGTRRYPEYDGGTHREVVRHHDDLRRDKAVARLGGERFGYTSDELVRSPLQVVRDAEDALGLPHDTARAKWWLVELDRSSISRAGRTRLQKRLRRFDRTTSPRRKRAQPAPENPPK